MIDTEEIPVARPFTEKYTDFLNLTVNESDSDSSTTELDIDYIELDISNDNNEKTEENKKKRKLRETSISSLARKRNNKGEMNVKKKVLNEEDSQQPPLIVSPTCFRKSESFDRPEFLLWLESNQHLCTIKGGASNICELLDKVRVENPALNKIFLAFAEKANPHFFDIAQLVRPNNSLIFPPKWNDRTDLEATYVWSFDIPSKDLNTYCEEIEKDIFRSSASRYRY